MVTVVMEPSKGPVGDVSNLPLVDVLVSVTIVVPVVIGLLAESCLCTVMVFDTLPTASVWVVPAVYTNFVAGPVMAKTVVTEARGTDADAAVKVGLPTVVSL